MNYKAILIKRLPAELHTRLKVYSAKSERSMADLVVDAIETYLNERPLHD